MDAFIMYVYYIYMYRIRSLPLHLYHCICHCHWDVYIYICVSTVWHVLVCLVMFSDVVNVPMAHSSLTHASVSVFGRYCACTGRHYCAVCDKCVRIC